MANKTIHTKNSAGIYYKVLEKRDGSYDVRKQNGLGFLHTDEGSIGKVNSVTDAINLVKSDSGKKIREIREKK